jgi:translocator protein
MRTVSTAGFLIVVVTYAFFALAFTSYEPGWYASLPRPKFQPPDWLFGIVWPLNFISIAVVGVLASQRSPSAALPLFLATIVSAAFAVGWAYLFYVPHALLAAAWSLVGSAGFAWLMVVLAGRLFWAYGVGLLIYAIWMTVATALAFGYAKLLPA